MYIGAGDIPEDCNVQIDPDGDVITLEDIAKSVNDILSHQFGDAIVCEASGGGITLNDSSNRELRGLTLYGTEETASTESVTVKVGGKNLFNKDTVLDGFLIDDNTGECNKSNYGHVASDWIPISGDYATITTIQTSGSWGAFYDKDKQYVSKWSGYLPGMSNKTIAIPTNAKYVRVTTLGSALDSFQLELGSVATAYEPYKEPQTLVVPTPNGLQTGKVLEVDARELHTYKPNTTITNDSGAKMSVEYVADTKAYIDNKFTELQSAILASGANV